MDPISLPLAVIGITQAFKLAAKELAGFEVKSIYTIIVAVVAAALLTFVNLESELIQNIYTGIVAVGGLTTGMKILGAIKK